MRPLTRFATSLLALVITAATLTVLTPSSASARGFLLKVGSRGAAVRTVESRLHRISLLPAGAVDRRYRRNTARAVATFQRGQGLRVNGKVNQLTWNALALEVHRRSLPVPTLIAHRGATSATSPENTLASLRAAVPLSSILEFDLRLTADRQLVLMHDPTLDRTTNCTGAVSSWTLADLRASCTVGGQPIPTFDQAVAYAATTRRAIAPELKPGSYSDADLASFRDIVVARGLQNATYVQSFDGGVLRRVADLDARLRPVLVAERAPSISAIGAARARTVAVKETGMSSSSVATYHRAGLKVWTWTPSDVDGLQLARDRRVDAVVTNAPALARSTYRR